MEFPHITPSQASCKQNRYFLIHTFIIRFSAGIGATENSDNHSNNQQQPAKTNHHVRHYFSDTQR